MEKLKTIQVRTVIEDEDSLVQGGVDFYWVKGSKTVLYQSWEHRASGPVWGEVTPDPMCGDDFLEYLYENWSEYRVLDVEEDFC